MMAKWLVFFGLLFSVGAMAQADSFTIQPSPCEMAVTFDDLPFVEGGIDDWTTLRARADELLRQITVNHIPAVGFVNEAKLYRQGQLDEQSVAILSDWLDAGLELGNHTYSHAALSRMPLEQFEQDVIRGEAVTSSLLAARGMKLRYFRHPYLQVGNDTATRAAFEKFLAGRGYTIAPVTVNHADWIFAAAYDRAEQQGNPDAMQRVVDAYIPYMEKVLVSAEQQSTELFGRQIRQVLLLHANSLNAAHFGELVDMIKRHGYKFITLADALHDPAYGSPNNYHGTIGVSWLDQWALTVGLTLQKGVAVPAFIKGLAGLPAAAYQGY